MAKESRAARPEHQEATMSFEFTRQQSHHAYDKQRLHHLKRLARPVLGTLFVAAFATVVFKSPPPSVQAPEVAAAGAAAVELRRAEREEPQLDPLLLRLEPASDQHG